MSIVALESETDYVDMLAEIDRLAESEDEDIGALQELISLVAAYELRCFPPEPAGIASTCPWHRRAA